MRVQWPMTIGTGNMAPRINKRWIKRDGKDVEVSFYEFDGWVEDEVRGTYKDDSGKNRKHSKPIRVSLRDNETTKNLWAYLEPGRKLIVTGRYSDSTNIGTNRQNERQAYTNREIRADHVKLIDSPPMRQVERLLDILEGKEAINAEVKTQYMEVFTAYFHELGISNSYETSQKPKEEAGNSFGDAPDFTDENANEE